MDHFELRDGELWCEDVPLAKIAEAVGTPVYVYSRATLERHATVFAEALAQIERPWLAYALKSNPNLAVVKVLQRQGFGADVVSAGELARALAAGVAPGDVVFSGVGKTARELAIALDAGIGQFNLEVRRRSGRACRNRSIEGHPRRLRPSGQSRRRCGHA